MSRPPFIDRDPAAVLTERYLEVMLGDPRNILLLVAQAPAIGAVVALAFGSGGRDTPTLYFVMVLTAIWFGCINSCREIVKERRIYLRERMFNLNVGGYVLSKVKVLAVLSVVQCGTLMAIVNHWVPLRGGWWQLALIGLVMVAASFAGMGLGLFISALTRTDEKAVGLVPLVILPQIIFSEFAIDPKNLSGVGSILEKIMIARWAFEGIREIRAPELRLLHLLGDLGVLLIFFVAFFLLTHTLLRFARYSR